MKLPVFFSVRLAALLLACSPVMAAEEPVNKALEGQVARLVELLRDSFATGYPEATKVQTLKVGHEQYTLAVFTIEGFGGGNNYSQYLAVFTPDADEQDQEHYQLMDVMPIGAGGWRAVESLAAKVVGAATQDQVLIDLPVMQNSEDDAVNFPTQAGVVHLVLQTDGRGRLLERP